MKKGIIFLDRDGVLNEMVVDAEHGTINSPLHPSQVKLRPKVAESLRALEGLGYRLAIVSNQPAAAKGLTTRENLEAVHATVLAKIAEQGGPALESHLCFHRSEDGCACRKPKTGLLEMAWAKAPAKNKTDCWMVGDGLTDIQAGLSFGVQTAFIAPRKSDALRAMVDLAAVPQAWFDGLSEFVSFLKEGGAMEPVFSEQFLRESVKALETMDASTIEAMAGGLASVRDQGGRLFILGVGGSAGHASHAVNDFRKICGFEAYCPTDNVSELTARINDDGWDTCLRGWLEGSRLNSKDGILVFSVGGGNREKNVSTSLIRALELATERDAKIFGIIGKDGGFTKKVADACVLVPVVSDQRITPHTEGLCAVVWHLLVSHPLLQVSKTKWESVAAATECSV